MFRPDHLRLWKRPREKTGELPVADANLHRPSAIEIYPAQLVVAREEQRAVGRGESSDGRKQRIGVRIKVRSRWLRRNFMTV